MAAGHQPSTEQTTGRKRNGKQSEEIQNEADTGIVEGSEVRFKVTINGQSAEIVATVAEA